MSSFIYHGGSNATAEDFYYVYDSIGRKFYYYKDGKNGPERVGKEHINPKILANIGPKNEIATVDELRKSINALDVLIAKLSKERSNLQERLNFITVNNNPEEIAKSQAKYQEDEALRRERKAKKEAEWKDYLHSFFREYDQNRAKSRSNPEPDTKPNTTHDKKYRYILVELQITTKKEWKAWLRNNHPDKNSNIDITLCQEVISAGRAKGW